jgi:hypothetical protein
MTAVENREPRPDPAGLVRGWMAAAVAADTTPADDDLFAQWLDTVAMFLAARRQAS